MIECAYCWQVENLTPEQMLDPANQITSTVRACARHESMLAELGARLEGMLVDRRDLPKPDFGGRA